MVSLHNLRPGTRTAIVSALLAVGTLLLFSRAIGFDFLNYDDPVYVTGNRHVQGGLSWAGVVWAFTGMADYWHPLSWLSHMLDWQIYGSTASGHHLTSVVWHALNAVLAFLVFRRLTGSFWRSALAAALFAWHPLRVESVVWITERKDVMSGCFFLLTLLAYARYVAARAAGRPARGRYLLVGVAFVAGLMSKPMLVSLPLVLLLLDFWPFARGSSPGGWRFALLEKVPLLVLSGVTAVVTIWMQVEVDAFVLELPLGARVANAVVSCVRYLGKFLWPFDLIVCYSHPGAWPAWVVLAALAMLLGLAGLAWHQRRTRPWIAIGLGWYLVTLLPVIGLIQVGFQAMADRYTYLSLLGIELALIWSIPKLDSRVGRAVGIGAAAVVLAGCAVRTWDQEAVWRDSVTLFEHAARVEDQSDIAADFLAAALFAAGRFDEAAVHAERARALNPRNDRVLVTLAGLAERKGRVDEAMAHYRLAITLQPDNPVVQCELGLLELGRGRTDEARALMIPALRAKSNLRERARQIGRAMLEGGDPTTALVLFDLVLGVAPDDAEAQAGAGIAHLARQDPARAIVHLRAAVALAPEQAEVQLALAGCAEQLGRTEEMSIALGRAEAAARDDASILAGVADFHARRRDFAAATRLYRRVVELDPGRSEAHVALGFLLIHAGDRAGGIAAWKRALELNPDNRQLRERLQLEMTR